MPNQADLEKVIDKAFKKLLRRDRPLFDRNVCERAISHKFAMYLEQWVAKWPGKWDVDCEFNRHMRPHGINGRKEVDVIERFYALRPHLAIERTTTVFPDVIIHKRGPGPNLLVIEAKTNHATANDIEFDRVYKLPAYIHDIGYLAAAYVTFDVDKAACSVEWIKTLEANRRQR
ncbi:MAG TPA: hypothetical protein VHR66_00840 [Gemmataceae bacterium]|jgi:hypothetical protein|nr:hypothetical protein [Gemmataceae bacterium]